MTLPASGALTFSAIQTEFGGTNPIIASEYYNGGAYVSNGAVPSSGAISLSVFYGLSAESVSLSGQSVTSTGFAPQSAGYNLESDGDIRTDSNSVGSADVGDWITPKVNAPSDYQCRATLLFGDSPAGDSLATWLALTTTRGWYLDALEGEGNKNCSLTVEIRKGTGAALTTATITLEAEHF